MCNSIPAGKSAWRRRLLSHNVIAGGPWVPNSKFPRGMKWYADRIRERGFRPGIWVRPFHVIDGAPERGQHPEWFNEKGQMDFSHPEVISSVRRLFQTIVDDWGYEYVKFDFPSYDLFGEWGPKLFGDHAAHAEPHNQQVTMIQSYRSALQAIREATQGKAKLLACNSVMAPTLGDANVFRIGDDVGDWSRTYQYGVKSAGARYYTNGITWTNDPDVLLVREPFTIEQARMWASLIVLSGGVVFISENFSQLPDERLEILKKAMPVYKNRGPSYAFGRPVDLLENNPPQIWNLEVQREFETWNIIGLFNWSDVDMEKKVELEALGLSSHEEFHLFEFWKMDYVGIVRGSFTATLPAQSYKIFSLRKIVNRPQVLSTQRHLTQGGIELKNVRWDQQTMTLAGVAHAIKGNPYSLLFHVPSSYRLTKIEGAVRLNSVSKKIVRAQISSRETADVVWNLQVSSI